MSVFIIEPKDVHYLCRWRARWKDSALRNLEQGRYKGSATEVSCRSFLYKNTLPVQRPGSVRGILYSSLNYGAISLGNVNGR